MLRKIFLPTIFVVLGYGFWISPDFKEIAAGVAIFLFGMLSLEEGFRAFTGGILERILKFSTDRLWKSVSFGVLSTTLMQSSSLVSVITISFLSAGLLGLSEGIGIIFGANLGTTTGAWLVAGLGLKVKISSYAMPMLVFGVIMLFQKPKVVKGLGYVLAGLGFLFLGIHHMKEGFEAFRETIDLAEYAVGGYPGLFLFALIGIAATVIMQSSHATLVLIITALAAGQITYENALALAIGANVGTTITAIIGSLSANEQGKRLAGAHLVFNVVTGLIAIIFIAEFVRAVDTISLWVGIRDADYTLKLAVFHTLFNLVGVLVMLPFIGKLVQFFEWFIKTREPSILGVKYLNDASVDFPETALEAVRNETLHIYDNAVKLIANGISMPRELIFSDRALDKAVARQARIIEVDIDDLYERSIKGIYSEIVSFTSQATFSWEMEQTGKIHWLRNANRNIVDSIKDIKHLRKNLLRFIVTDNATIRGEYNRLRVLVASVLRELDLARRAEGDEMPLLSIDALKLMVEESDDQLNERLVGLLRDERITPAMATSLMNDSGYALDACRNLLEMGETLFVHRDEDVAEAERDVALSDEEIDDILDEGDSR
ncbi:sodium:phosphate symporter [Solemya pervernicosa gill symbiont]|uniref:Sodium:phosphate symporter n=2 Tax=Gammaproteobacteria incertae sedis TaxID=118884 RepID=A0A1T2L6R7_9GAMM|nr:Na/Pi symporter [Candidatus Reidiella endopervernicosa]OOZ40750.1 sodium:phosphate symporter [Solemya pervernicosa gill symbiont]QKQ26420.1 Na/Pi cotransporter family protein [Candidatus Reidiella endopervernicosa]